MLKLIGVLVFYAFLGSTKADYCEDNFTLSELPEGILKEAISVLIDGTIAYFLGCPDTTPVPDGDVKFWFYSRSNPEVPILLDQKNPIQVDPKKPTKILVPGWLCNVTNDRMPQLRKAYLQRYDCNVIGIDWTARSIDLYTKSFCSIPGVAKIIGAFLCKLNAALQVDLAQVHMVGHSMGGQISGISGQEVQKQCNMKLGRITGLDPAGPLYQNIQESRRLDASDAEFVDVIHTNQAILGYFGSCGDADFFPNCGTFQPGCVKLDWNNFANSPLSVVGCDHLRSVAYTNESTNPRTFQSECVEMDRDKIANLPLSIIGCNHMRSIDYMIESINPGEKKFVATSCEECPGIPIIGECVKDSKNVKYATMGEECPSNPPAAKFYLEINSKPPFAKG